MRIKTSELTGVALDWAVAKADGHDMDHFQVVDAYQPSTDWAQGGPIIEREVISVVEHQGKDYVWFAWEKYAKNRNCTANGPTILITAMRCYVASKLGYEIDVPEELL
jgi:hypothetical protein